MNGDSFNILLNKIKNKEQNSRQYKILADRLVKCFKKEQKYRDIRVKEESKEISKNLSKSSDVAILDSIKKVSQVQAFNKESIK